MTAISVFCDESCHLEKDQQSIMLLGAVWCPAAETARISTAIRSIKEEHHARGELKWTKVSSSRLAFFSAMVDLFFSEPVLNFRSLIVTNKELLNHSYYNKDSHDSFYFKMYFYLLRHIVRPGDSYRIYLDIKDTRSQESVNQLWEILANNFLDFERQYIQSIQQIRSTESEILQLADFLLGAVAYKNRGLKSSEAKLAIVGEVENSSGLDLTSTTPPWDDKFNLFFFTPRSP
ncbi:MAG: DUF3800 domain-containing protein [Chloroflexi bacterium]|nr:DUF3800 domain-containing protein [Chloroflexota bacterium]MCI0827946.1 DUF3800 domain-containing protein [Chloroflexota bacterium]MCI0862029.1 DUF3800 domain-containing protein [Chloroflexota bacterium]MCI0876868.1 DUF3800 domain-containing protein [Chloroflexota bacterium]MCI0892739.1 DUF3800 domain-containing protein [Chloroflexota bacterium]